MSKKIKFCPNCWADIKNIDSEICPKCGKNFIKNEESNNSQKDEKFDKIKENIKKTSEVLKENSKVSLNESEKIIKNTFLEEDREKTLKEKTKENYNIFLIIIICILVCLIGYLFGSGKINFGEKKETNSGVIETQTGKTSSGKTEEISTEKIEENSSDSGKIEKEDKKEIIEDKGVYKVISNKAFFYNSEKKSYVMAGDIVYILGGDVFFPGYKQVCYYTNKGNEICGWIKDIDLKNATDEEIKKDEKRREEIEKSLEKKQAETNSDYKDEEYKNFIISHYNEIKNKNYYTAFHNYQYPKAKNVDDFAGWYKGVYEINLSKIEKIGKNEYRYIVYIYSDSGLNEYETSTKIGEVDGKTKILGYGSKKIN